MLTFANENKNYGTSEDEIEDLLWYTRATWEHTIIEYSGHTVIAKEYFIDLFEKGWGSQNVLCMHNGEKWLWDIPQATFRGVV